MNDRQRANFDLDQMLHPAQAFGHPSEAVNDPHLTLTEKRAILGSWTSDACAVEARARPAQKPGRPSGAVRRNHGRTAGAGRAVCRELIAAAGDAPAELARSASFENRRPRRRA
jgi:hypothetical protein